MAPGLLYLFKLAKSVQRSVRQNGADLKVPDTLDRVNPMCSLVTTGYDGCMFRLGNKMNGIYR